MPGGIIFSRLSHLGAQLSLRPLLTGTLWWIPHRKLLNHPGSSASLVLDRTCVCELLSLSSRQCPQAGAQKKNKNWKENVGGICLVYTNTPKGGFSSSLSRFRFILVHPEENLSFV